MDLALDKILKLNPITFNYKQSFYYSDSIPEEIKKIKDKKRKNRYGFSAQAVEKVLPEVVGYNHDGGFMTLNYIEIIPILTKAIQEQHELILDLQSKVENGHKKILKSTRAMTSTPEPENDKPSLVQNQPNPFTENTRIEYYLPPETNQANLYIYNMQGKQIDSHALSSRGHGHLTIQGHSLPAGMYLYALVADGKEVGTKRMMLTE